jgi:hypothetical protein
MVMEAELGSGYETSERHLRRAKPSSAAGPIVNGSSAQQRQTMAASREEEIVAEKLINEGTCPVV